MPWRFLRYRWCPPPMLPNSSRIPSIFTPDSPALFCLDFINSSFQMCAKLILKEIVTKSFKRIPPPSWKDEKKLKLLWFYHRENVESVHITCEECCVGGERMIERSQRSRSGRVMSVVAPEWESGVVHWDSTETKIIHVCRKLSDNIDLSVSGDYLIPIDSYAGIVLRDECVLLVSHR